MLKHQQRRIALGSPVDLTLVSSRSQLTVDEWFRQLWIKIFEFEQRFSRFLPDSELSQFNRAAGLKTPTSPEFHDILDASLRMSDMTGGFFNPFILPALQSVGYVKSMVATHSKDSVDDFSGRAVTTPDQLKLTHSWASIPYGTALDLGGIGKGYLGDELSAIADKLHGLDGYWFSLGGDIVAEGVDENGEQWKILIQDTSTPEFSIAGSVRAPRSGRHAVATSSILRRTGTKNGKKWHHIIDPRTNMPSSSNLSTASISASSLMTADILASCAIILGSVKASSFCKERNVDGVLLQTKRGSKIFSGDVRKLETGVTV